MSRYDEVDGQPATHLGDGVYAVYDGYGFSLRANDHGAEQATDIIYLEPNVLEALKEFEKGVKE